MSKKALIVFAVILSVISLIFIEICIEGIIEYAGLHMSNEARGWQSLFTVLALIFTIPPICLWVYIFVKRKTQISRPGNTK